MKSGRATQETSVTDRMTDHGGPHREGPVSMSTLFYALYNVAKWFLASVIMNTAMHFVPDMTIGSS